MAIGIGSVVNFKTARPDDPPGRVCKIFGGVTCCVQFPDNDCQQVALSSLREVAGDAPACKATCSQGC